MTALKKLLRIPLLCLAAFPCCALADNASLDQAEKLFQSGDAAKAVQAYKAELAASPGGSTLPAAFFYNYGTALARTGAMGEAYVALLRAAYSAPFDSDTKYNLHWVENKVPATTLSVQPAGWYSWWPGSLRVLPWKFWLVLGLSLSAAAFVLARMPDRSISAAAGVLAALLFVWCGLAWSQNRMPVFGVVALAKVKSGPGDTFSNIITLEPGSLVSEEAVKGGWLKIRFLKDGSDTESVGWVEPLAMLQVN